MILVQGMIQANLKTKTKNNIYFTAKKGKKKKLEKVSKQTFLYEIFILVGGQHVADFSVHHRARYLFRPPPPHPLPLPHILHNINACCLFRLYNSTHVKLISLQSVTSRTLCLLYWTAQCFCFPSDEQGGKGLCEWAEKGIPGWHQHLSKKKRKKKRLPLSLTVAATIVELLQKNICICKDQVCLQAIV